MAESKPMGRITKLVNWAVILLLISVSIAKNNQNFQSNKSHHFENLKNQPACFASSLKATPTILKEFNAIETLSYPVRIEFSTKLLLKAVLVSNFERNYFYKLITINAP